VNVANTTAAVTSAAATLTVTPVAAPTITTQPASQTAVAGGSVQFSVVASGAGPLTYQWRKDGAPLSGATSSTLSLSGLTSAAAGSYSVTVTNVGGSTASAAATLTITPPPVSSGSFFGSFGGGSGSFALYTRPGGKGVFLGFANPGQIPIFSDDITIDANGRFSGTAQPTGTAGGASGGAGPGRAAVTAPYRIEGTVSAAGVTGTVAALNLSLSAPPAASSGATASLAGYYAAGSAGSSSRSHTIVGPSGDAFVLVVTGDKADAGKGTIAASGNLTVTTASNTAVSGTVSSTSISLSVGTTPFTGHNSDAVVDREKLINVSTRSQTGVGGNVLIAGFVITGDQPKQVLIRGIGPALAGFGVAGALEAVQLDVFRDSATVATGSNWGTAANAATIAATAARVGAFALATGSRDAALLLSLAPGGYTAQVRGQGGVSGVSLVEVYDATEGTIPNAQRIINISTRSIAGAGDDALIAGFIISGAVPKRVLIRGIGPALTQFGVSGALALPQLSVYSGTRVVAQNANWGTSADAAAIATASTEVGAFALAANSADAAVVVYLAPGAYTAHVAGTSGASGVALVEVYELP
ncbi:MAG TPA: immunoglobulin domain-containing protein, partial [Opitutaceae bacterium]